MNKLKNSKVYLAGPIQYIHDAGVKWREEAILRLKELGIKVFNPIKKPSPYISEIGEECEKVLDFIKNDDFEGGHTYVKEKIVRVDLRMVDLSDFLIVYINPEIHTCGTYHELFHAWEEKKPVLVFVEGGRKKVPAWLLGVLKPYYIFDSLNDIFEYLHKLDSGEEELDSKWILFDEEID